MFALSIYQSYVGVSIGLCIMLSVLALLRNKDIKEVLKDIGKTILAVLIGGILYYIVTQILLKVSNLEISAYKSAESISILSIFTGLQTTFIQTYKDFLSFFFGNDIVFNTNYRREVIYGVFFLMFVFGLIASCINIKDDKKNKIIRISLAAVFTALLPVGLNIIDILVVGNAMYALTAVQMILMIPFAFAIVKFVKRMF